MTDKEIIKAAQKFYANEEIRPPFSIEQSKEISSGFENGLTLEEVEFYAHPYFTPKYMKELREKIILKKKRDQNDLPS